MTLSEKIAKAKTPAQKAAATKALNKYVAERVADGKDETQVRAAIKARVTRLKAA